VKWTEASPTPAKSGRGSTPDSKKRYSTPITKTTAVSPRERSSSVRESKLTSRLIKKITPSTKKASSSEEKASTASSSSTSSSSTDLTKGTGEKITRGTPRRQTYVKKASNRPTTTETTSTTTHLTPQKVAQVTPQREARSTPQKSTQSTLQKPDTKFDRRSPQRHTYNKKQPTTAANKAKDETSDTPKVAQKRPRETISELRQRMQQAKKAAAQEANKDGESDIQIFVSASTPNVDHQDELHVNQVIDDEGSSNEVTSSSTSLIDVSNQSGSQRKQWGTKDVCLLLCVCVCVCSVCVHVCVCVCVCVCLHHIIKVRIYISFGVHMYRAPVQWTTLLWPAYKHCHCISVN